MHVKVKRSSCCAASLILFLSFLVLAPCSIVASVNLGGSDTMVVGPFVGLYVSKVSSQQTSTVLPTALGWGSCSYRWPNRNPQLQLGDTLVTLLDCAP